MIRALGRIVPILGMLVLAGPARAANEQQIRASINRAIDFLKSQRPTAKGTYDEGGAALVGIALIEAGVPTDDPAIQATAKVIRQCAIDQHKTYQIALDIMFLDKLGEDIDTTLIQSMGARLLAGQTARGGWGYFCPRADGLETQRLTTALQGAQMKGGKAQPPTTPSEPVERPPLAPEVADMLRNRRFQPSADGANATIGEDNSNTQFAILGLWAARRRGLPVEIALAAGEARFRSLQTPTGGWGYSTTTALKPSPSMTCSGLLALAIGIGNSGERSMKATKINPDGTVKTVPKETTPSIKNPLQDRQVQAGFQYLGAAINANIPSPPPAAGRAASLEAAVNAAGDAGGELPPGADLRQDGYFLWSLERVCVVYGVNQVGGKDWHAWGTDYLVRFMQLNNGSFRGRFGPEVDTAFSLMFLSRANLVRDLTRALKAKADGGNFKPSAEVKPGSGAATNRDAANKEVVELAKALVSATGTKQAELLKQYSDPKASKGSVYTLALAHAIPQLSGEAQKAARQALADRLSDTGLNTIRGRLRDEDPELRRAAAIAAAMRDEKELVPDLIELLADGAEIVVRGARLALKSMSGQDFGPPTGFTEDQRTKAIADWREWAKKQSK